MPGSDPTPPDPDPQDPNGKQDEPRVNREDLTEGFRVGDTGQGTPPPDIPSSGNLPNDPTTTTTGRPSTTPQPDATSPESSESDPTAPSGTPPAGTTPASETTTTTPNPSDGEPLNVPATAAGVDLSMPGFKSEGGAGENSGGVLLTEDGGRLLSGDGESIQLEGQPSESGDDRKQDSDSTQDLESSGQSYSQIGAEVDFRREAGDTEKCLRVDEYAAALARFFLSVDEGLCFALFGHWGRGKTFLMNSVSERLRDHGYAVVRFSAWKYRTTPELWIHLYETLLEAARRTTSGAARRAGYNRVGFLPAILILLALLFSLIPLAERITAIQIASQVFGVGGVLYLLWIGFRTVGIASTIAKLYQALPSHREKLGLQATVGDDLRDLLRAWTDCLNLVRRIRSLTWRQWLLVAVYYVLAIAVGFAPLFHDEASLGPITLNVTAVWIACLSLAFGFTLLPISAFARPSSIRRVLLVVDDLDRCDSDSMLEVMESLSLFLDEEGMAKSLQVCMLLEEDSLELALRKKYERLIAGNEETAARVVRENVEKFFLVHLRMPELQGAEVKEIMRRWTTSSGPITGVTSRTLDPDRDLRGFVFSDDEKQALNLCANHLLGSSYPGRWGPRAIRCFLMRYQLARILLSEMGEDIDPDTLANLLLSDPTEVDDPHASIAKQLW